MDVENEVKIMLTETQFNEIVKVAKEPRQVSQTNHYFDTREFTFKRHNITLRVREEYNQYQLTLKAKTKIEENITTSEEYNQDINNIQLRRLISDSKSFINIFNIESKKKVDNLGIKLEDITYLGKSVNNRLIFEGFDSLILHLDKTIFPGENVEYELEIENVSDSKEVLRKLKHLFNITPTNSTASKFNRFVNYLTENTDKKEISGDFSHVK